MTHRKNKSKRVTSTVVKCGKVIRAAKCSRRIITDPSTASTNTSLLYSTQLQLTD